MLDAKRLPQRIEQWSDNAVNIYSINIFDPYFRRNKMLTIRFLMACLSIVYYKLMAFNFEYT